MRKIGSSGVFFCSGLCLALLSIVLLSSVMSGLFSETWFGTPFYSPVSAQVHFFDRFFIWDAVWYDQIATRGYRWDQTAHNAQNVAFFPLWPLILRTIYLVGGAGEASRPLIILLTTGLACTSVFAFHSLANKLLDDSSSRWATAFYTLNPAANFMLQSYPTGLINLLAILSLTEVFNRRYWRAAVLSGVATAAGPLTVFLSATIVLAALADDGWAWLKNRSWFKLLSSLIGFAGLSVISLSGVLLFMVWLQWKFHDPVAFITAQDAWIQQVPLAQRIGIFLKSLLPWFDFEQARRAAASILPTLRMGRGLQAEERLETALGYLSVSIGLLGIWAAFLLRPRVVALYGWLVIAAYIWMIGSSYGGYAASRIIYAAVPSYLGWALLLHRWRLLAGLMLILGALTLALQETLTCWGHWVI